MAAAPRTAAAALHATGHFEWMSRDVDEAEHSIEMHLPYVYHVLA